MKKELSLLKKLKSKFQSDEEALGAIDLLLVKMKELAAELEQNQEALGSDDRYPLPELGIEPGTFLCFSDGACRGNPGPGGWGYMVQSDRGNLLHEDNGFLEKTTNNQMELTAAIEALDYVTSVESVQENLASPKVILYSDSKYVLDGLNSWVHGWKSRGWKKADKKPPENLELWQRLDALRGGFAEVRTVWVKGHSGHPQNERCDELANMAIDEAEIW